jgi:hypothetical protein
MGTEKRKKRRKPGAWRGWAADVPDDVFLAPMDPEDLDAAEGLNNDEWGVTLPEVLEEERQILSYNPNISPVGWYIGSYLLRFVELEDQGNDNPERRFLTWENTILVKAANLNDAYDKVVAVAQGATKPYKGGRSPGVDVQWVFEGVSELLPIHEEIGDGAEVMWAQYSKKLKNIRKRARTKAQLNHKPRGFVG